MNECNRNETYNLAKNIRAYNLGELCVNFVETSRLWMALYFSYVFVLYLIKCHASRGEWKLA